MLTVWYEYQCHLKPHGRRQFWSSERMALGKSIRFEIQSEMFDSANDTFYSNMIEEMDDNLL
jgi:hypothetical protein